MKLVHLAPARLGTFLAGGGALLAPFLWILSTPVADRIVNQDMDSLRSESYEIFRPVVILDPVDMVDTLFSVEQSPELFLHYEAVLENIAVFVAMRMFGGADMDIAISGGEPTAFPQMTFCASSELRAMTRKESQGLTFEYSSVAVFERGDRRLLPASAHAKPRFVGLLNGDSSFFVHSFCSFCSGPMSLEEFSPRVWYLSAATFTGSHCNYLLGKQYHDCLFCVNSKEVRFG